MSTGYRLSIGYLSGGDRDDAWKELLEVVERLRVDAPAIVAEVRRIDPGQFTDDELRDYAEAYALRQDLTLTIYEPRDEHDRPSVMQMASGGGRGREIKEAMRRAFCRLVIEAMHRKAIEVSMVVS